MSFLPNLLSRVLMFSVLFSVLFCSLAYSHQQIESIVVIGDSLSDDGNLHTKFGVPPSPPYFNGRFSNGPTWPETLAHRLGIDDEDVVNLARGGATTGRSNIVVPPAGGMLDQLDQYMASSPEIDSDTLFVVWGGANDLFGAFANPQNAEEVIVEAVTNLATIVATLSAMGAQNIVVPNLPNLGSTPESLETGNPQQIGGATALSVAFNGALAQTLAQLEAGLGIETRALDVFGLFDDVLADPAAYDLVNVTERCLAADLSSQCEDPDGHLFWDGVHPTEVGHAILAEFFLSRLVPRFVRGDCDGDGVVRITDGLSVLRRLFMRRSRPACMAACDVNGDGRVRVDDGILIVIFDLLGGHEPLAPFPDCGPGLLATDLSLGCEVEPEFCQ